MMQRILAALRPTRTAARRALQQQQPQRHMSKKRAVNVVLLEDLSVRGFAGEEVSVKPGFARNFLIPTRKAVYATPENKERHIVQRSAEELALLDERRDFLLFKERAARKPLSFTRQVALDGTTLEQPVSKADLASAIRKQLKRRVEEADIRILKGTAIRLTGEATVRVEVPLPKLMLQEAEAGEGKKGGKAKTTEAVEVMVVVTKDETKRERRPGADAEGGGAAGSGKE